MEQEFTIPVYGETKEKNSNSQHRRARPSDQRSSIKTKIQKRSSAVIDSFLFNQKLIMHMCASVLLITYLIAHINYLWFKASLYYKEFSSALKSPWVLLIFGCELIYLVAELISSLDHLVPLAMKKSDFDPKIIANNQITSKDFGFTVDPAARKNYPTVDVLVTCCNEPSEIPQESIQAALALNYPKDRFKVLVLDDGDDDNLKAICEALRVESGNGQLVYLRRNKVPGVPRDFKCGNLNFGLQHSTAEFIAIVDADMILHPSFLDRTLPHIMSSSQVSFVQIPQSFYNLATGDPLNESCCFFYEKALLHRNVIGCATCVGTGAVFRRKHLNEIDGFQPQTITEDTMTSFVLFNRGYKSVYINEKLQIGLVPWTFSAFLKQRQRWGQGAMQQFASTWRIMLGWRSNLNVVQKVFFFWHTAYYYLSIINIILVLTIWSALAFQLNLIVGSASDNRTLMSYMAIYFTAWRVFCYVIWTEVPQSMQSRNRDESSFWWMTPFFFQMIIDYTFNSKDTFNFVPTNSTGQCSAGKKEKRHPWLTKCDELKHVWPHLLFIVIGLSTVAIRSSAIFRSYVFFDCKESLVVLGLSIFILSVCVHMSVPVMHILWPTSFKPEQRKDLLRYNTMGVPTFDPEDVIPEWQDSVLLLEGVSLLNVGFWLFMFWVVNTNMFDYYCTFKSTGH
ncbi:hypothetical protein KP509_08G049900 [Ceratopteris richardii]|uniref:Glycosyltransferase 2-like domain-containing protein n=1 Tax=Ceratopteris richardii TaxID=49495 RepID=A0A8T2UGA5_CERRI|nr:hypothetical protein KP509_08G049900 [Ceratopteris richardii]KAH7431470.1 hypothetical protein KP509_08G049900 [Ceratopteris richardii]